MTASTAPEAEADVLFIPVSSPTGSGEYFRALTLMRALHDRQPGLRIACCLNVHAKLPQLDFVRYIPLENSPTRESTKICALIAALRPRLVIFDSTSRQAQLRSAHNSGCRTLYISSREGNRATGFQLRKLRYIDEHWIMTLPNRQALSRSEGFRLKLLRNRTRIRFAMSVQAETRPARQSMLKVDIGLPESARFALFAPGSGAAHPGVDVAAVFGEAARRFVAQTEAHAVLVAGPMSTGALPKARGLVAVRSLSPEHMADLVAGASLIVCGGGALLLQACASRAAVVATSTGNADQVPRIRALASQTDLLESPLAPEALQQAAVSCWNEQRSREPLAAGHSTTELLDAIEGLLAAPRDLTG